MNPSYIFFDIRIKLYQKGGLSLGENKREGKKKKNLNKEELNKIKGGKERHRRNRS